MSPLVSTFAGAALRPYGFTLGGELAAFELISSQISSGVTTSITFSSIPSEYKHLQIRAVGKGSSGSTSATAILRLNSDSGSNYSYHNIRTINGSSVTSTGISNSTEGYIGLTSAGGQSDLIVGNGIIDILDYSNTNKYKTMKSLFGSQSNTWVGFTSSLWRSNSAVNSITLTTSDGNGFYNYRFSLYGVN